MKSKILLVICVGLFLNSNSLFAGGASSPERRKARLRDQLYDLEAKKEELTIRTNSLDGQIANTRARIEAITAQQRADYIAELEKHSGINIAENQKQIKDAQSSVKTLTDKVDGIQKQTDENVKTLQDLKNKTELELDDKVFAGLFSNKTDTGLTDQAKKQIRALYRHMNLLNDYNELKLKLNGQKNGLQQMEYVLDQSIMGNYVAAKLRDTLHSKDFCQQVKKAKDNTCDGTSDFKSALFKDSKNTDGIFQSDAHAFQDALSKEEEPHTSVPIPPPSNK